MFWTLVKKAGVPPLTLHGLRHTFATIGLDEGIDVLYIAEVLGHASPAITQSIYQHTRPRTEGRGRGAHRGGDLRRKLNRRADNGQTEAPARQERQSWASRLCM
jgi:hypothetical protein